MNNGDFFNTYLVDDYNALDTELNGAEWFQKQEEHAQQQMMQQNRPEIEKSDDQSVNAPAPVDSPFRNTYDRKKQNESRQERLQRIKEEYNVPYISFSSLQERRKQRKQQIEKMKQEQQGKDMGETVKDGLAANTPGFTQLVEENEPTTTPLSSMGQVKDMGPITQKQLRTKAISFENDPEAVEWFEQESKRSSEEKDESIEDLAQMSGMTVEELEEWLKKAGGRKRFCKRAKSTMTLEVIRGIRGQLADLARRGQVIYGTSMGNWNFWVEISGLGRSEATDAYMYATDPATDIPEGVVIAKTITLEIDTETNSAIFPKGWGVTTYGWDYAEPAELEYATKPERWHVIPGSNAREAQVADKVPMERLRGAEIVSRGSISDYEIIYDAKNERG